MQLRKVDLNLLVTLDALLRERSVTKAAAQLFLSQSAMSHSLNRLRELLGDPLLVRGPGGLALTPRAEELREPVHQALLAAEAVVGHGGFNPARSTRLFTLGTTDYFDSLLLPRLIEGLRAEAPGVRVLLRSVVKEYMVDDLSRGTIDLAISFLPKMAIHSRPLLAETYACVLRSRGRGARSALTLQDYLARGHVLVSPSGTFSGAVDDELARRGLARQVVMSTPRYLSAAEIVARSDLVLTVQSRLAHKFVDYLPVRVLDLPVPTGAQTLTMQWSGRTHGDPANAWLRARIAAIPVD